MCFSILIPVIITTQNIKWNCVCMCAHIEYAAQVCVGSFLCVFVRVSRSQCVCVCVCVCVSVWQVHCSVEEVRLAHTDMRQLSLPPRPCPFNPGWQWAALHMAWASCIWRRAARGKTRITTIHVCVRVCVCVDFTQVCVALSQSTT